MCIYFLSLLLAVPIAVAPDIEACKQVTITGGVAYEGSGY